MRKNLSPAAIVGIVIVALIGIGLLGWKLMSASTSEPQAVVKAADPNDPKFRPDPKLSATGGGGAESSKNNSND